MDYFEKAQSYSEGSLGDYTSGLTYPATKDDIIAQARRKHMPEEIISRLEKMPDKKYENVGDVISSAVKEAA